MSTHIPWNLFLSHSSFISIDLLFYLALQAIFNFFFLFSVSDLSTNPPKHVVNRFTSVPFYSYCPSLGCHHLSLSSFASPAHLYLFALLQPMYLIMPLFFLMSTNSFLYHLEWNPKSLPCLKALYYLAFTYLVYLTIFFHPLFLNKPSLFHYMSSYLLFFLFGILFFSVLCMTVYYSAFNCISSITLSGRLS